MLSQGKAMILNLVYDESTKNEEISFSVFHSDYSRNQMVQELMVATLVKYGSSGRYETYLASEWEVSSDKKKWTFKLNQGVYTENNIEINAHNFKSSLIRLLKFYAKNSTISVFTDAVGWHDFQKNLEDLEGIKAIDKYTLEFNFVNPPSGFLEYLSMPFFGFYVDGNFEKDVWKNDKFIISSSKYRLKEYGDNLITLELRKDFKLTEGNEPILIKISTGPKKIKSGDEAYVFENKTKHEYVEGATLVHSTPTVLNAVVLSPFLAPFQSENMREAFLKDIQDEMNVTEVPFYFKNDNTILKYNKNTNGEFLFNGMVLKIFMQNLNDKEESGRYLLLWDKLSKKYDFKYEVDTPETLGKNWIKLALTNKAYHIRVARVDIGGAPENWGMGMMFCTSLGIRFPDPTGNICKIYEKYKILGIDDQVEYEKEIFKSVQDSMAIAPIRHTGFSWYFSNNVDLGAYSQTMPLPKLDLIKLK